MTAHCRSFQPSVVYFILSDFGAKLGMAWVERDIARMSRAELISDIRDKQITNVVQIIETEFGCPGLSSRDVTEEIMAEVGEIKNPMARIVMGAFDRLLADIDRDNDLRKHEVL